MGKIISRYWGYLLLLVVLGGWFRWGFDPALLAGLSVVSGLWIFFQAPGWCGAKTRGDVYCRNNARGLLMGCHLRQHKWQKLLMLAPAGWRRFGGLLVRNPISLINCGAGLATMGSLIVSVIALIVEIRNSSGG